MLSAFLVSLLLILIQIVALLPWAGPALLEFARATRRDPKQRGLLSTYVAGVVFGILVGAGMLTAMFTQVRDPAYLRSFGGMYAAVLQAQLIADGFVIVLALLQLVWPKGGAVTRAAFREGHRQPMFWLFVLGAFALLTMSPFIPYFTFGEDHIMVKELGFDTLMLAAVAFGSITASMSISEEIEGRTAVTLMSKPISRRQFLLGKYFGIYLTCLVLMFGLGWYFNAVLIHKRWFDQLDFPAPPQWAMQMVGNAAVSNEIRDFLVGTLYWAYYALDLLPDQVKSACEVMVLVSIAVTLATRLPMVVNLVTCLVLFFLANLMPVLVLTTRPTPGAPVGPVQQLLGFVASVFDALLPSLELFAVQPTLVGDEALPVDAYLKLVGSVGVYGIFFTTIVLLVGLVLFEDRDLA